MADPTDGGTEPGPPSGPDAPRPPAGFGVGPAVPPPGFAGGRPTAPPGFAGAGPGPALGQVPVPPVRPTTTTTTAPKGRGAGRIVIPVVVLLVLGAAVFFFVRSGDDESAGPVTTTTLASGQTTTTVPGAARLTPGGPGETFQSFVLSVADGDTAETCELLSSDSRDEIVRRGQVCAEVMASAGSAVPFPKGAEVVVLGEVIDGDRAEVSHQIGEAVATKPAVLVKQDDGWKVALFAKSSGMGNAAGAQTQACQIELRTVETAVQAYFATEGEYPPDASALVGGFLTELPQNSKVNPDGTVTMVNDCA